MRKERETPSAMTYVCHGLLPCDRVLLNNPFDEELKGLGQEFALLLRPMIETVDRCGLKAHFLCKHKVCVEQFYTKLAKCDYRSDMALSYKKRFEKNRDKLFTFLAYDGIPWNNNN